MRCEELHELLELGAMAPSGGNVQPWRARASPRSFELFLDPVRSKSFIDVHRYASVMALGSFTENVAIAATHMGIQHDVSVEDPGDPTRLVVRFTFRGRTVPAVPDPLFACIRTRCTNRQPNKGNPIPQAQIDDLTSSVSSRRSGNRAFFVSTAEERAEMGRLLGRADRLRMVHRDLHAQAFSELRWTAEAAAKTRDGIDTRTLELPAPALFLLKLMRSYALVRHFFPKVFLELPARSTVPKSSHLCVLAMPEPPADHPHLSFVGAGRDLERLWLTAERHELAVHPWAVLPFFGFRAIYASGAGFSARERSLVVALVEELRAIFEIPTGFVPYFIMRLSRAARPRVRARRLDWRSFAELAP